MKLALFSSLEGLAEKLHYVFTAVSRPLDLSILKRSSPEAITHRGFPSPPAPACRMGSQDFCLGG